MILLNNCIMHKTIDDRRQTNEMRVAFLLSCIVISVYGEWVEDLMQLLLSFCT